MVSRKIGKFPAKPEKKIRSKFIDTESGGCLTTNGYPFEGLRESGKENFLEKT